MDNNYWGLVFGIAIFVFWFGGVYLWGYLMAKMESDNRKFLDELYNKRR